MRDQPGPSMPGPLSRHTLAVLGVLFLLTLTPPAQGRRVSDAQRGTQGQQPRPSTRLRRCDTPARLSVNGVEPMARARGHVTLVALLTSTCQFCIRQAHSLEDLHRSYLNNGTDVHMIIMAGGPPPEGVFERIVSFDVYHDDTNLTAWTQVFKGNKDDILIFNRCGKLTYHLPFPYSYLSYNYVTRAISLTLSSPNLCPCTEETQDPHDRMMGDSPSVGTLGRGERMRGHHGRRGMQQTPVDSAHDEGSSRGGAGARQRGLRRGGGGEGRHHGNNRCAEGDQLCRELRRGRKRYERFRAEHDMSPNPNDVGEDLALRLLNDVHGPRGPAL